MRHRRTRLGSLLLAASLLGALGIQGCGDGLSSLFGGGGDNGPNGNPDGGPYGILGGGSGSGSDGSQAPPPCVNLCKQQVACPNGGTTTLSGTVFAPEQTNPDPVYNAIVYVPNAPVQPFTPGVSCDKCGAAVSGSPLVTALTGPDGKFSVQNVPVGDNIPLVVQIGRWRRQVTIPHVNACTDNPVDPAQTRLPRNKTEGDIPLTAISTGSADALECVLRKMGIDDSEFTLPSADGRIRLYHQNGAVMSGIPAASTLWSDPNELAKYDIVILDCEGVQDNTIAANSTAQQNLINYTNEGGRVFASHFSYVWLFNDPPFMGTAQWTDFPGSSPPEADWGSFTQATGILDTSFPKGQAFAQWLGIVNALSAPGQISINEPRHNADAVNSPQGQRWIYTQPPDMAKDSFSGSTVQHFTFNTPVGQDPTQQCGRVVFSSFHVTGATGSSKGLPYPTECDTGPMLPQEKVLEFMLFDLASCIQNDNQPPMPPPGGGGPNH